eukprot:1192145-Prymnesium_polylepis.1
MDATCSSCTARPAPASPFASLPLRPVPTRTRRDGPMGQQWSEFQKSSCCSMEPRRGLQPRWRHENPDEVREYAHLRLEAERRHLQGSDGPVVGVAVSENAAIAARLAGSQQVSLFPAAANPVR